MMKLFIIPLIIFHCALAIADNRAIIESMVENNQVSVGDSFWVKIYLIPEKTYEDINDLMKEADLASATSDFLDFVEIGEKKISDNNHDILEVKALVLLKKEISDGDITIKLGADYYFAKFSKFKFVKSDLKQPQGYVVLDTDFRAWLDFYKYRYFLFVAFSLTAYLSIRFYLIRRDKKKKFEEKNKLREKWVYVFKNAKERNQYEFIVQNIEECKKNLKQIYENDLKLKEKENLIDAFLKNNRDHFYQKEWSEETANKINLSFNYLRDVFDGEFRI